MGPNAPERRVVAVHRKLIQSPCDQSLPRRGPYPGNTQTLCVCANLGTEPLPTRGVCSHIHRIVAMQIDVRVLVNIDCHQQGKQKQQQQP